MFKKLKDLELENTHEYNVYESYFTKFYDRLKHDIYDDIQIYKFQYSIMGSSIIELASSVRWLSLEFAIAGFILTRIGISDDMLKLKGYPDRFKRNLNSLNGYEKF